MYWSTKFYSRVIRLNRDIQSVYKRLMAVSMEQNNARFCRTYCTDFSLKDTKEANILT